MNKLITVLLCLSISAAVSAKSVRLGVTYTIAETDLLEEIQHRAEQVDWQKMYDKDPSTWSAYSSPRLAETKETSTNRITPVYTVEQDVLDKNGKVIYPAGFSYNPLKYFQMPARIVFIGATKKHIEWAKNHLQEGDLIITSGGDPIAMAKALEKPVFILSEAWIQRLELKTVPTIAMQDGEEMIVTQYRVDNDD